MRTGKVYAVYKGDDLIVLGTLNECAEFLKVQPKTIQYLATPTNRKRNTGGNSMEAFVVEDYEEEKRT